MNYKKKYQELQKELVDLKINQHTKRYIHIPFRWKAIGRLSALLGSIGLAIANFFLIIYTWSLLGLGSLDKEDIIGFNQLLILYPLIGEYILIGLVFICLIALIKGGFNKINSFGKGGLIGGLIFGLIFGLIYGLIGSLIGSLIGGLIYGLIIGLIFGLIVGLIYGLIIGLIIATSETR